MALFGMGGRFSGGGGLRSDMASRLPMPGGSAEGGQPMPDGSYEQVPGGSYEQMPPIPNEGGMAEAQGTMGNPDEAIIRELLMRQQQQGPPPVLGQQPGEYGKMPVPDVGSYKQMPGMMGAGMGLLQNPNSGEFVGGQLDHNDPTTGAGLKTTGAGLKKEMPWYEQAPGGGFKHILSEGPKPWYEQVPGGQMEQMPGGMPGGQPGGPSQPIGPYRPNDPKPAGSEADENGNYPISPDAQRRGQIQQEWIQRNGQPGNRQPPWYPDRFPTWEEWPFMMYGRDWMS